MMVMWSISKQGLAVLWSRVKSESIRAIVVQALIKLCDALASRGEREGYSSLVLVDMPPQNLKVVQYKFQFSRKSYPSIYQSAQFWPNFDQFQNFLKFE